MDIDHETLKTILGVAGGFFLSLLAWFAVLSATKRRG